MLHFYYIARVKKHQALIASGYLLKILKILSLFFIAYGESQFLHKQNAHIRQFFRYKENSLF